MNRKGNAVGFGVYQLYLLAMPFMILFFLFIIVPLVLAIPQYIILNALGIVNTYWVYILPSLASSLGLFLMKQFMEQMVPDALIEAAQIDGAGEWMIFSRIVMPVVKPAWFTLIIFCFKDIWNSTG